MITTVSTEKLDAYPSFAAALSQCGYGYEDPQLAEVMLVKTQRLLAGDLRKIIYAPFVSALQESIASVAKSSRRPVRVLDFGGNFGLYYFLALQITATPLRWAVVESATMAKLGAALASDSLGFFDDVAAAGRWLDGVDLVFANGSLSYPPDPIAVLSEILDLGAQELLVLRSSITDGPPRITIQESGAEREWSGGTAAGRAGPPDPLSQDYSRPAGSRFAFIGPVSGASPTARRARDLC